MADTIFGTCDPRFAQVEKVFKKNFFDKWEREGAEIAVYYNGQLVVDLQGGYKDASANVAWTEKTKTVVFSVTKAVAALSIWKLIDKGRLRYDQKIIEFWPAFGKNGKDDITVEDILTHRSALPIFDKIITLNVARDSDQIAKIIEEQAPLWLPSSKRSGYHAITYGWLLDQIVRRVDEKKRSLSDFSKEEIFIPNGIDFHIGLPDTEASNVSRLSVPSTFEKLREICYDPRILIALSLVRLAGSNSVMKQAKKSTNWIQIDNKRITFNSPEVHKIELPSALGITKARELAKLFALKLEGKILSPELVERFYEPQFTSIDIAIKAPLSKGFGFMYEAHPLKPGKFLYGHPGYGGSSVVIDGEDKLVIAYVTNGLKLGGGELTRTYRLLRNATLQCVQALKK
ncbi:Beta-lactamase domain-containing protein [Aphelenchoides bicaudatus]|nr:Beta-lactamase domain-containing protein [Aphelenchoides bicaudatus]